MHCLCSQQIILSGIQFHYMHEKRKEPNLSHCCLLTLTGWGCITPHSTSLTSPCLCSIESVATVAGIGSNVVECSDWVHDLSIGGVVERTTVNS